MSLSRAVSHGMRACQKIYTTEIINIKGIPTKVRTWGNTLTDTPCVNSNYIVFIPGNPGLIDFYIDFLGEIHNRTKQTVWSVGHAGHDDLKSHKMPPSEGNEYLFNVEGQINHKINFIENYVPKDVKITFIGHSMGTYVILKLLQINSINERVLKSYLLFPTIENLADTQNGQFILNRLRRIWFLLPVTARFFQILPGFAQNFLLNLFLKKRSISDRYADAFRYFINPYILRNFAVFGLDATLSIKERDNEVLKCNIDNIKMYYGANDQWTPLSYYESLKRDIPNIDAEVCSKGFAHSFVLQHSVPMAEMVVEWMEMK